MNILIAAARAVIWTFIIQSRKCWEEELFLFPPPRKTKAAWCQQWQICGSWVRIDMSCSCNQSLSKLAAVPASWGDCDSSRGREVIQKSRADGTSGLKEKKKKKHHGGRCWHLISVLLLLSWESMCALTTAGTTCSILKAESWYLFPALMVENPQVS